MAQERLVAVSYPADEEFTRINSEVLAGEAAIAYTYELDEAQRVQTLRRAEAVLSLNLADEVPAGAFAESSRLRFVQMLSAGVDAIDFASLPDGLMIASNAGAYSVAMSEHVLAMTLSLVKHLPQRHAALAAGRFDKWAPSLTLDGAICVILGLGGIGTATARLMAAFGARVYAINRSGRSTEGAEFTGTLADLAPAAEFTLRIRTFRLELLDRGERFLAHPRGVDGLGGVDHLLEQCGDVLRLGLFRPLQHGE